MSFDGLAPHYWWLERLSFGGRLQWCRTALLPQLADRRKVLVVGDGDGRFLEAFLRSNPHASVDSLDVSPGMIALARRRVAAVPGGPDRVRFTVADVRSDPLPDAGYDLVVTNFLLDCFPDDQLAAIVDRLAAALAPGGRWLVGDFALPPAGWPRPLARLALAGMYLFFRATTRLPARRLADPSPHLLAHSLTPIAEATRMSGFLQTRLWQKNGAFNPPPTRPWWPRRSRLCHVDQLFAQLCCTEDTHARLVPPSISLPRSPHAHSQNEADTVRPAADFTGRAGDAGPDRPGGDSDPGRI